MDTNIVIVLVVSVIAIIAAVLITAKVTTTRLKKNAEGTIGNAEEKAREIIDEALKTAENKKRESLLEVKEESIRTKNELDKEIKERRAEAQRYERRVQQKEENIDKKADAIEKREASLAAREETLGRMKEEVSKLNEQRVQELERISGLTSEQAKDYLLKIVEDEVKHESAVMIKEMESRAKEEADKKAKAAGAEYTTKDYKDILADKDIDAVIICSSTDTHSPISIEAIKAGKHVFCEKPIDHDVDKIKEVIKTLEGTGLKYQVGFNRRFDHNFEAAQRAVVNGKIGAPHIIKITSRDPEPPSAEYVKVSGGMFLDMTIHDFDMVRFLAGCDAEEVYVQAANLVDPEIGKAGDVDTAIITLKMENGALAVIDNSRQAVYGYDQRAEVFGSKGMVAIKNDSDSTAVISNEDGVTGEKPQFFFLERYMDAYGKEMVQFIDAIENDTETPLGVEDGLKPVLMGLAAKKSVEEGRPVKISEIEF